jgi:hypothetical protein
VIIGWSLSSSGLELDVAGHGCGVAVELGRLRGNNKHMLSTFLPPPAVSKFRGAFVRSLMLEVKFFVEQM